MSLLNGILLAVAALIIGIIIGRFTVRSRDAGRLEQELKKAHTELESYQGQINTHFSDSAALMEQLAEQYQTLYRHMAEQSKFLAKAQEPLFREALLDESNDAPANEEPGIPPRDYAGASGLLKQSS
ncbi:YhcB family protein [Aeromonas salmonicida]|uniref:YhcB family protein n=1 Tax=Aeromonas salmonicida TaxID=645 RepID=UPI00259E84AE|nr:YhcB family protein [Aeromonas salmonicida]MDM5064213.1 YhcB family protein [Aeromonas salmonicida]